MLLDEQGAERVGPILVRAEQLRQLLRRAYRQEERHGADDLMSIHLFERTRRPESRVSGVLYGLVVSCCSSTKMCELVRALYRLTMIDTERAPLYQQSSRHTLFRHQ